jgi:hypothetical protein
MALYRATLTALLANSGGGGGGHDKGPKKKRNKLLGGVRKDQSSSSSSGSGSGAMTCLDLGDGPVLTVMAAQLGYKVLSVESIGPFILHH